MKAGQAAKWSAHIFQWEEQLENVGYHKFLNWKDIQDEFKREFCPVYAVLQLQTIQTLQS